MHAAFLYYDLRQAIRFEKGQNYGFHIFLGLAEKTTQGKQLTSFVTYRQIFQSILLISQPTMELSIPQGNLDVVSH